MTTWLETTNTKQNGEPVTRRIKIPEMDGDIWFTDNGFAEVSDDVGDILANNIDSIAKVSEPDSPGTYYGDAGENTTIEIVVPDGAFDSLTVESLDSDVVSTDETRTEHSPPATEGQSGLEAVDGAGATIDLEKDSTYVLDSLPFNLDGDDVTLRGSRSSVITVPDGVIDGNDGPSEMVVKGDRVSLSGFTFDGNVQNQGADDTYGMFFEGEDLTAIDVLNQNAAGDAFGAIRPGSILMACRAEGFTEDGFEFGGGPSFVVASKAVGIDPIKISVSGESKSDCYVLGGDYVGDGSPAITITDLGSGNALTESVFRDARFAVTDSTSDYAGIFTGTIRDTLFESITFEGADTDEWGVKGDNANFQNCTFRNLRFKNMSASWGTMVFNGDNNLIDGIAFGDGNSADEIELLEGTENVIRNVSASAVKDGGTRTLINGRGTNDGDPSSGGDWNGNAAYAHEMGATIEDTTNGNLYKAMSDETWTQIG